jgi:predicted DsbA family dithiol-disulfide isomerase
VGYARELGLDTERFRADLRRRAFTSRLAADVESADQGGVSGTPIFFINDRRRYGAYDIDALARAVRAACIRASVATASPSTPSGSPPSASMPG